MTSSDLTNDLIAKCKALIACPSITPDDAGAQTLLRQWLIALGFRCETITSGKVINLWAKRGENPPLFVFAGHTDVVPSGNLDKWSSPPFELTQTGDTLVGRGIADMKGGICAMISAVQRFYAAHPNPQGSIAFLITSGEEGDDFLDGTPVVMKTVTERGEIFQYCVVGEPSSQEKSGDMIKVGRRGSLTGTLQITGKQGHVAYPHLAVNALHQACEIGHALTKAEWGQGTENFPATSLQITSCSVDTHGSNVIPGHASLQFNFRFNPLHTPEDLQTKTEAIIKKITTNYILNWRVNGLPFITKAGPLLSTVQRVIHDITKINPELSTSGGTSDGRFIAPYCPEIIELGLPCHSIHQINESTTVSDLSNLSEIYYQLLCQLIA